MIIQKIKSLLHSRFLRNVAVVATGTAGAQAITVGLSPIITRLYGPEAFGALGTFMAILAILTPVAALTYPIAIVLPRQDEDAKEIVILSCLVSIMTSLVVVAVILIWGEELSSLVGFSGTYPYLWLIPCAMIFAGLHQVVEQWVIRKREFKLVARVSVVQSMIINSLKVGLGMFYPTALILIALQAITSGVNGILLYLGLRSEKKQLLKAPVNINRKIKLASKYREFPVYRAPEAVINALSYSFPILFLAASFGPAAAGFYTLARSVLSVPALLVGKSVADVLYPHVNEAAHNGDSILSKVKKITLSVSVFALLPFGVMVFLGPLLFAVIFGEEWGRAGEYARWLSVSSFFIFIVNPSVRVSPIASSQRLVFVFSLVSMFLRVLVSYIAYLSFNNDLLVLISFVLVDSLISVLMLKCLLIKFGRFDSRRCYS